MIGKLLTQTTTSVRNREAVSPWKHLHSTIATAHAAKEKKPLTNRRRRRRSTWEDRVRLDHSSTTTETTATTTPLTACSDRHS